MGGHRGVEKCVCLMRDREGVNGGHDWRRGGGCRKHPKKR